MTEENKFKVEDKVKCINSESQHHSLTKGKIYVVKEVDGRFIKIIDDEGNLRSRFKYRFKLVKKEGKIFIFRKELKNA